jgi:hypothetical protein
MLETSLRQFGLLLKSVGKNRNREAWDTKSPLLPPLRRKVMADRDTNFT